MDGEIDADELASRLEDGAARVVDIRSPAAFERGHIPGSENVPFPELIDDVERFDGEEDVVTVCPKGESSVQAARLIAAYEGFDGRVESLRPGLRGWDGPVESGPAADAGDSNAAAGATEGGASDEGPDAPF